MILKLYAKRWLFTILVLYISIATTANASWAYGFVVYNDNIYAVSDDEVEADKMTTKIGQVSYLLKDETAVHSGNVSNMFPKGTEYYEIPNVNVVDAIAIKSPDGRYVRANFSSKYSGANNRAPTEEPTSNLSVSSNYEVLSWVLISITAIFILILAWYLWQRTKRKQT